MKDWKQSKNQNKKQKHYTNWNGLFYTKKENNYSENDVVFSIGSWWILFLCALLRKIRKIRWCFYRKFDQIPFAILFSISSFFWNFHFHSIYFHSSFFSCSFIHMRYQPVRTKLGYHLAYIQNWNEFQNSASDLLEEIFHVSLQRKQISNIVLWIKKNKFFCM